MTDLLASFQIAYVADIVCALILLIFAAGGAKKGFVKCFFGLISTLVALILAITLASTVAGMASLAVRLRGILRGQIRGDVPENQGIRRGHFRRRHHRRAGKAFPCPASLKTSSPKISPKSTTSRPARRSRRWWRPSPRSSSDCLFRASLSLSSQRFSSSSWRKSSQKSCVRGRLHPRSTVCSAFAIGLLKAAFIICAILAILSLIPSEGIVSFFDKTLVLKYIYNKNPLTMLLGLFIKF